MVKYINYHIQQYTLYLKCLSSTVMLYKVHSQLLSRLDMSQNVFKGQNMFSALHIR